MKSIIYRDRGLTIPVMVDVINPDLGVQIKIVGDKVWVNVDGMCVLRASKCPIIEVENDQTA